MFPDSFIYPNQIYDMLDYISLRKLPIIQNLQNNNKLWSIAAWIYPYSLLVLSTGLIVIIVYAIYSLYCNKHTGGGSLEFVQWLQCGGNLRNMFHFVSFRVSRLVGPYMQSVSYSKTVCICHFLGLIIFPGLTMHNWTNRYHNFPNRYKMKS